jgi:hypothetical protein
MIIFIRIIVTKIILTDIVSHSSRNFLNCLHLNFRLEPPADLRKAEAFKPLSR